MGAHYEIRFSLPVREAVGIENLGGSIEDFGCLEGVDKNGCSVFYRVSFENVTKSEICDFQKVSEFAKKFGGGCVSENGKIVFDLKDIKKIQAWVDDLFTLKDIVTNKRNLLKSVGICSDRIKECQRELEKENEAFYLKAFFFLVSLLILFVMFMLANYTGIFKR